MGLRLGRVRVGHRLHGVAQLEAPHVHAVRVGREAACAREIQGRYRGDAGEIRGRCGGDKGEMGRLCPVRAWARARARRSARLVRGRVT